LNLFTLFPLEFIQDETSMIKSALNTQENDYLIYGKFHVTFS